MSRTHQTSLAQKEFDFPHTLPDGTPLLNFGGVPHVEFTGILIQRGIIGNYMPVADVEFRSPPALKGKIFTVEDHVFNTPATAALRQHGTAVEGLAIRYEHEFTSFKDTTEGWVVYKLEPLGSLDNPFPHPPPRPTLRQRLSKQFQR